MWGPADGAGGGTQAQGIPLKPNNGKPENALPYTPYCVEDARAAQERSSPLSTEGTAGTA